MGWRQVGWGGACFLGEGLVPPPPLGTPGPSLATFWLRAQVVGWHTPGIIFRIFNFWVENGFRCHFFCQK